jgi:serine/threonine-protein kinase
VGSYEPVGIPLEVSVNSNGEISLSVKGEVSAPTPLGVFSIGVVVNPVEYFGVTNTLTIRVDCENEYYYDLHGNDFDLSFKPGYYQEISLKKAGTNLYLDIRSKDVSCPPLGVQATPTTQSSNQPIPIATLQPIKTRIAEKDGMVMVYVPEGNFLMGSTDNEVAQVVKQCYADTQTCQAMFNVEKPQHTVWLDAFWIDQTDITNSQYQKCVNDGSCQPPECDPQFSGDFSKLHGEQQPVICVDWNQAKTYCDWAGRRLPTEAEWEKAARGTDGRIYPWGNQSPEKSFLNYAGSQIYNTTDVGSYPSGASPYGALDMTGNVRQWVADWFSDTYYRSSPNRNPQGPSSGQIKVLRGGSAWDGDDRSRAAYREPTPPDMNYFGYGFRCAISP